MTALQSSSVVLGLALGALAGLVAVTLLTARHRERWANAYERALLAEVAALRVARALIEVEKRQRAP